MSLTVLVAGGIDYMTSFCALKAYFGPYVVNVSDVWGKVCVI